MTTESTTGQWEQIGGREGGTVSALAFSPAYSEDRTLFAATLAGVFRSTDAGARWQSVSTGLLNPFIDALAVSPAFAEDRTVFAGGREAGVSRSSDGGETWEPLPFWSQTPPSIAALALSPNFVANGLLFAGSEDGLVYRSANGGRSWDAPGGRLGGAVLVLAVVRAYGAEGAVFAGTAAGVYRSDDNGETWTPLGLSGSVVQALAVSPAYDMDGRVYVGTEGEGVLVTLDGGENWQSAGPGIDDPCVNGLALSPGFMIDDTILAATASGLARSADGGNSWEPVGAVGAALCVAIPPPPTSGDFDLEQLRTAFAGTAGDGIARGADAGQAWSPANDGLNARLLVTLAISPAFTDDQTLFACGLEEGVHRSRDGGVTWAAVNEGLPALAVAGLAVSPNFGRDRVLVAATSAGVAISRDGGDRWTAIAGPVPAQAVALSPTFSGSGPILAAGPDGAAHLSADGGLTWRALSPPFAGEEVAMVAFSPSYAEDATLIAASSRPGAAGDAGRSTVWLSRDGGATWESAMVEASRHRWLAVAVPPTFGRDGALYIGLGGRVLRPMRRAAETRFGGRRPISIGEQPGGARTTVVGVALSPAYAEDETLFAATSTGVYVSRNAGLGWRALSNGLTDRSIVAAVVSPGYAQDRLVYAASLGGAIWRLRDAGRE